ncbi:MAG TPA: extracellular solute-binding protein [Nostocaceae cyanobacterium]|nr:extracellular solute-binding protein [Nostocaceae cyanobacterium]
MDRRSFLFGTSTLIASQLLMGCNNAKQYNLIVELLKGSVPEQVVSQFRSRLQVGIEAKFVPVNQIGNLFQELVNLQKQSQVGKKDSGWLKYIPFIQGEEIVIPDLVTLGDYWLKAAIEQKLIQPLEVENIKNLPVLNAKWQESIKRDAQGNPSSQGKIWGLPYRWGNTVIIYNRDKFQQLNWLPTDWSDLWRSELRSRISLLNHHREVIGLVLKKLGKSYNTENIEQIPNLQQELQTLNQQVKLYSSTNYLEPILAGDTWLAVGWSNDVVSKVNTYQQLGVIVPQSGTAIWADLWVRPANANQNPLLYEWIDFCWQPNIAEQIALLTKQHSPINVNINPDDIPEQLQNFLLSNQAVFERSEFILPLSSDTNKKYQELFSKMKNNK